MKNISGIYAIKYKGRIIYIGKSKNVRQRINQHFKWQNQIKDILSGRRNLTQAALLRLKFYKFIGEHEDDISVSLLEECSIHDLNRYEEYWISKVKPIYNWEGVVVPYNEFGKQEKDRNWSCVDEADCAW